MAIALNDTRELDMYKVRRAAQVTTNFKSCEIVQKVLTKVRPFQDRVMQLLFS